MPEENGPEKGQEEFKPITSQDELNKLIGARINQVKSQFADYDDIKAKAAKVDEAEQASKTELEKAQERIRDLEQRSSAAERSALAARIASEEGVIPEVVTGDTEEEMRAAAKRVLEWRDSNKRSAPPPKKLASGSSAEPKTGEKGRAAAALRGLRNG
jgi:predicted  nucleic acid-binding Zn-ribbon protein